MNHIRRIGIDDGLACTALNVCHPETKSKDPMSSSSTTGKPRNFRIAVRFFDDHDTEVLHGRSREAATACSRRRKPWVGNVK